MQDSMGKSHLRQAGMTRHFLQFRSKKWILRFEIYVPTYIVVVMALKSEDSTMTTQSKRFKSDKTQIHRLIHPPPRFSARGKLSLHFPSLQKHFKTTSDLLQSKSEQNTYKLPLWPPCKH